MGNDSARDPKRTKRADVLDEVKPRLSWGRSLDSRRVGGHDVGGFVKPTLKWEARLCEEVLLPICNDPGAQRTTKRPVGRAPALFGKYSETLCL